MATSSPFSPFSRPSNTRPHSQLPKCFSLPSCRTMCPRSKESSPNGRGSSTPSPCGPWAVGRGPWGLIGGRYFPVTCPCKSLNFTSTSTAPPHTFGSSSQSHHHNAQHPLCPFHAATKRLQGEATVVQFIRIPVWSCQRQSQVRPVLHRQIQPAFTTCPASDSQSSPEHFQSCRHHTTCFPCLPYPPPSYSPPPPPSPGSRIPLLQVAGPVTEVLAFSAWPHSDRCFTQGAHIQQKRSATAILVRPVCRGLPLCPRRGTLGIFLSLMGLKRLGPPARYLIHHSGNWYKSRQRCQIMAEAWLGPAVWSFKPIGLARWHISCH